MNVQVEVTTRCNFACFYCAGRNMQQKDMSLEQYIFIIDRHVARYGVPQKISLQGEGEPTINKAFFRMAAYARGIGSEPCTITNGTYKYPEHFIESFSSIGVSIDTLHPYEAERIGRYNLPRVLEFVDALDRLLPIIIYSVALSPTLKNIAAWCNDRGFKHIVQPLQTKEDYRYRYPRIAFVQRAPKKYRCGYLKQDIMRYYSIDAVELPCCYIKNTSHYITIDDLRSSLARGEIPYSCRGCRYLE